MSKIHVTMALLALFLVLTAPAQTEIPASKLPAVKRGTVLVSTPAASGSGFVVATQQNKTFIVTCAHLFRGAGSTSAMIVFNSGTPSERRGTAEICAVDAETDLAILSLAIDSPPESLPAAKIRDVPETTPVFVFGFPLPDQLARPGSSPTVTVARASISSLPKDESGAVTKLQLDGELNPGNSGGPIVNAAGEVLGMAVAKVMGTNISFGVPVAFIESNLMGRVKNISFGEADVGRERVKWPVTVQIFDPLGAISKVTIVTAPKTKQSDDDASQPPFKRLAGGHDHNLDVADGKATGDIELSRKAAEQATRFQVKFTRKKGPAIYTSPEDFPELDTPEAPASTALPTDVQQDFGKPDAPLKAEKTLKLPAEIAAIEVAGGGRYLVARLHDTAALTVVDLFKGEIAKHIRLPTSDFLFAAGGNIALVYLRGDNLLQTYDLATFERRKTKPNPFGPAIINLVMGYGNSGLALVRHSVGTEALSQASLSLLDTTKLEAVQAPKSQDRALIQTRNISYRDHVHYRANRLMDMVSEWVTSMSPNGLGLFIRRGRAFEHRYQHDSFGYLAIGDDGRVYTESGKIYTNKLDPFGEPLGMKLIPGLGGTLYLGLGTDGKLMLYEAGKTRPLGPLGEFPGWKTEGNSGLQQYDRDALLFDQRIIFTPTYGRIAFVSLDDLSIVLRPFDLKGALDASGVDYLVVTSNPTTSVQRERPWQYQIEAISKAGGVKFALEFAPTGMDVSESGLVTWKPAEPLSPEGEKVIVKITDRSGEETYHSFTLFAASGGE